MDFPPQPTVHCVITMSSPWKYELISEDPKHNLTGAIKSRLRPKIRCNRYRAAYIDPVTSLKVLQGTLCAGKDTCGAKYL